MAPKKIEKKIEKIEKSARVLLKPRVTEKSALLSEAEGIYTFNVSKDATKRRVVASVKAKYKVTPLKVRLLAVPGKPLFFRGKRGSKGGGKKAYVYLKKGDKIEFA